MTPYNPYELGMPPVAANFQALSPLTFLERAGTVYPERLALINGPLRQTWGETYARCRRLGSALAARGIGLGDTVAVLAPNGPAMFEAHFGVPMCGAVLNAINTRLDAEAIGFILQHGEARVLLVDKEFGELALRAASHMAKPPLLIGIDDPTYAEGKLIGQLEYEQLLAEGDPEAPWSLPEDEWQAIALNYTSGTTGNPKGVVYHHRGAHLNALSNMISWEMGRFPVYLWTLPMFHCNGWCFPWALAAAVGTSVALRHVRAEAIYPALAEHGVDHFCGAPIVLNMLANASDELKALKTRPVKAMTAGAAPPAAVIEAMEALDFRVTHVYGLTETYGPSVVCAWQDEWDAAPAEQRARLKARQGVRQLLLDGLMVADPDTLQPVPKDGQTLGEIMMRGNLVMKGYLKNPSATAEAFDGGWFHSGDLAVWHPDGYVEIRDRSKDIIISGGENISSIEVEDALYRHPLILEAAVVAMPHAKWGETPCAFVTLRDGASLSAEEVITWCQQHLARFKVPGQVVFASLPKTSTGKVQKFLLREQARAMAAELAVA
ncbi:acyl-CoA synthetase [Pseudomonas sp. HAR-UPW-AIA-41]|uniref:acyl-CoA synthetase n=1 Tax=Pseudomonas sp. HAR-UPW-AIA-41 TaxID=1985301 RepID=UPI000BB32BE0|nr:acyl-CoA synthetase [Pseudomonas sp. HAR-UPW-AIA-41]PAV47115.1 acyl-CoA synthetase [Pseudomonas sp. HAR-UPW-AIA-41]